jgi:hypothetical protein
MGIIMFDVITAEPEFVGWMICFGMPSIGIALTLMAVSFACYRCYVRSCIDAASERVLREYPEFIQTREDFRVFARKVLRELGWDSVTFTFN